MTERVRSRRPRSAGKASLAAAVATEAPAERHPPRSRIERLQRAMSPPACRLPTGEKGKDWLKDRRAESGRRRNSSMLTAVAAKAQTRSFRMDGMSPQDLIAAVGMIRPSWLGDWTVMVACGAPLTDERWLMLVDRLISEVESGLSLPSRRVDRAKRAPVIMAAILAVSGREKPATVRDMTAGLRLSSRDVTVIRKDAVAILTNLVENGASQAVGRL